MPDELETILRLVADGHLSADDATPILEALRERESLRGRIGGSGSRPGTGSGGRPGHDGTRALRITVVENGRTVVNLRVPLGLAAGAVDRVPGLSPGYRASILQAIREGATGSIVDVGDEDDGVRVTLE
jgi:hypothetical protein